MHIPERPGDTAGIAVQMEQTQRRNEGVKEKGDVRRIRAIASPFLLFIIAFEKNR